MSVVPVEFQLAHAITVAYDTAYWCLIGMIGIFLIDITIGRRYKARYFVCHTFVNGMISFLVIPDRCVCGILICCLLCCLFVCCVVCCLFDVVLFWCWLFSDGFFLFCLLFVCCLLFVVCCLLLSLYFQLFFFSSSFSLSFFLSDSWFILTDPLEALQQKSCTSIPLGLVFAIHLYHMLGSFVPLEYGGFKLCVLSIFFLTSFFRLCFCVFVFVSFLILPSLLLFFSLLCCYFLSLPTATMLIGCIIFSWYVLVVQVKKTQ